MAGEELRTVLGFDAQGAVEQVRALTESLNSYTAAMNNAAAATKGFNSSSQNFNSAASKIQGLTTATSNYQGTLKKFIGGLKEQDPIIKQTLLNYGKLATAVPTGHYAKLITIQQQAADNTKNYDSTLQQVVATYGQLSTKLPTSYLGQAASTQNILNKAYATGSKEVITAANAYKTMIQTMSPMAPLARQQLKDVQRLTDGLKKSGSDMILTWKSVVRIFAIQVIHQAISQVVSSLHNATTEARNFVKALSEIQTVSGNDFKNIDALSEGVKAFASQTGQPLTAVTEGLYETLSNQVTDAAHSFEFLQSASDLSITAMMELPSAVNLLSSVINSYNMNVASAADISGKLFKAIELGRFRGQEIADTFGRVAGLSAQLGVSLDEVLASMATLTRSGMKYNEAFTLITNTQMKLISPTDELKARFKEMGIVSAEAGVQGYGFQGLLTEISKGSGDTASELAKLYSRIRAIRGALGLTTDYSEFYVKSLEEIKKSGADLLYQKKKIILETNAKQVDMELNKINVTLVGLGQNLTTGTAKIFNLFGGGVQTIKAFTAALVAGSATWIMLRTHAVTSLVATMASCGSLSAVVKGLHGQFKALASSPIVWAAAISTAVLVIISALNKTIKRIQNVRDELEHALEIKGKTSLIDYEQEVTSQKEAIKKILGEYQKLLFERQRLYNANETSIKYAEGVLFDGLTEQLDQHIQDADKLFDEFQNRLRDLPNSIKALGEQFLQISGNISDWKFDRQINQLDTIHAAYAQIERAEILRQKAIEAAKRGEYEIADALQQRANSTAQAAVSSADTSKNAGLIRQMEERAGDVMEGQLTILQERSKHEQTAAALIQQQIGGMRQYNVTLTSAANIFKDLIEQLKKTSDPIDREKILVKVKDVTADIQKLFGGIKVYANLANFSQLQGEFKLASSSFYDTLTGQITTFEKAASNSISQLRSGLLSLQDTTELQKIGIQLGKSLEESQTALLQQKGNVNEIVKVLELMPYDLQKFGAELSKTAALTKTSDTGFLQANDTVIKLEMSMKRAVQEAVSLANMGKANTAEYGNTLAKISAIISLLQEANMKGNRGGFVTRTTGIGNIFGIDLEGSIKAATSIFDNLSKVSDLQKSVLQDQSSANIIRSLDQQVVQSATPVKEFERIVTNAASNSGTALGTDISVGMTTGTNAVTTGATEQVNALKQIEEQAKRNAAALQGTTSGAAGRSTGGIIYKASGGSPVGTDTVPAMLTPGEFVMNANSSRRFYSQLVAMNSGRAPVYRSNGGNVTNNIGDIKINITESTSPRQTARETISLIKREIRRGTQKL